MVAEQEKVELVEQLIADTVASGCITPGALTLHADRGNSMRSKPVATLLPDLGIAKSHSRPSFRHRHDDARERPHRPSGRSMQARTSHSGRRQTLLNLSKP